MPQGRQARYPPPGGRLLERLTELARREVTQLRATGFASTPRSESSQVIDVMVRQLGHLFLQPMIDAMWRQLAGPATRGRSHAPVLAASRRDQADGRRAGPPGSASG